jgi:hypothetical protein
VRVGVELPALLLAALTPCLCGAAGGPPLPGVDPDEPAEKWPPSAPAATSPPGDAPDRGRAPPRETPLVRTGTYAHGFGAIAVGRGIRFNNPYRLQTQLGDRGESLSLSATYLDLSAGVTFGDANGLQHGGVLHYSEALSGIGQSVFAPGYVAMLQLSGRWLLLWRVGIPIVVRPDTTGGLEAAAGGVWYAMAGAGITAEVVGSLFYGAGTDETGITRIPMLSFQLGGFVDYEVLP